MNKVLKKELINAINNMKPKETNIVRQNGEIEVIAKGDEIETLSSKEITLKSIYELMISIKQVVNNLDSKVSDLDNKLNKVIELNNLKA